MNSEAVNFRDWLTSMNSRTSFRISAIALGLQGEGGSVAKRTSHTFWPGRNCSGPWVVPRRLED